MIDIFYPELWLPKSINITLGLDIEEEIENDDPVNM
jgi:hypothetical protein